MADQPHIRFAEWFKGQKADPDSYFRSIVIPRYGWSWIWVEEQAKDAWVWLADPENPKRFKKKFGPFLKNWCLRVEENRKDKECRAKLMSAEKEQQYYKDKRRGGHSNKGFEKVGDV